MEVRKSDISNFLSSFGSILMIEDKKLRNSVSELSEQLERYILFGKSSNYVLKDWEVNILLYMSQMAIQKENDRLLDLYPYYIEYLRNKQLEKILV